MSPGHLFASETAATLSVVFLVSAIQKLRRPQLAAQALAQAVPRFPIRSQPRYAYLLAASEAFLGCWLGVATLAGRWLLPSLSLAAAVLLIFVAYIVRNLVNGLRVPCGCFGSEAAATWFSAFRTALLGLLSGVAIVVSSHTVVTGTLGWPTLGSLYALATVLVAVFAWLSVISEQWRQSRERSRDEATSSLGSHSLRWAADPESVGT